MTKVTVSPQAPWLRPLLCSQVTSPSTSQTLLNDPQLQDPTKTSHMPTTGGTSSGPSRDVLSLPGRCVLQLSHPPFTAPLSLLDSRNTMTQADGVLLSSVTLIPAAWVQGPALPSTSSVTWDTDPLCASP